MQRAHNWSKRCLAMVVLSAAVAYVLPAVAVGAAETRTTIVSLPVGTQVAGLAVGAGALWVANGRAGTVLRIDPETNQLVASIRIAEPSPTCDRCWGAVAAVGDVVWAAMDAAGPKIFRIDISSNGVAETIDVGVLPTAMTLDDVGVVWLTGNLQDVVLRVDPRVVGGVARTVVHLPSGIFVAPDSVWVTARQAGTNGHLIRLNPITGVVKATIPVGRDPGPVVAGDGFAWVANEADHTLSRIDANTTSVVSTIPVIERPIGIAIGSGAVWVASRGAPLVSRPSVSRVDTRTGVVVETIPIDDASPFAMTAGADALWIASHNPDEVVRIGPVPLPANVAQASPPAVSVVMFGLVTTLVLVAVGVRGSSGHHSGSRSRLAGYLLSELLLARQGRRQDHAAVGNAERPAPELRT